MKVRSLLSVVVSVAIAGAAHTAIAAPIISIITGTPAGPNGKGADAEVRESQGSADLSGFVTGTNRGNSSELSTRQQTNNQSSVSYAKFDISSLPATSDTAFWDIYNAANGAAIDFFVRQNGNFKLFDGGTNSSGTPTDVKFTIRYLDPYGNYNATRADRSGNIYTASNNVYDWDEMAIDFYDAPGIQPFCKIQGSCSGADPNDFGLTRGIYDDFDVNAKYLGEIVAKDFALLGENELPEGRRLTYAGSDVRDVVMAALDAGQDTVTFMLSHAYEYPQQNNQSALGRNYNLSPRERDISNGGTIDNSTGAVSPTLRLIPEPSSMVLIGLGCLAGFAVRRKK